MESPFSFFRTHWDPEPTPNPSQEGNRNTRVNARSPPGRGAGVGRFMESQHDLMPCLETMNPPLDPSQEGN